MYRTLQDWRNVCNGMLISDTGGYQDQPQVVVNADGRSEHSTGISPVFPHSTSHFLRFLCGLILAGLSWSHTRYNLSGVYKKYDIDYSNEWGGAVLEGWSIGKPLLADDNKTVMMQYVSAALLLPVLLSLI